jgi:beta-N-acetylhexosaminidase
MTPAIFGFLGPALTADERRFFLESRPAGYILFKRNIETVDQVKALTDSLRELHGQDDLPILIDQEGGRVSRLPAPIWPQFPAASAFGALYDIAPISAIEAARLNAKAIALTLAQLGINVNCSPVLDIAGIDAASGMGERSFGNDPLRIAALGRAVMDGLQAGGVLGVIKHMPGHGRANVDSHHHLPIVTVPKMDLALDLAPFQALNMALVGMTCHVLFSAWDPEKPATISRSVINDVIRGDIGFDGLLLSDDLAMEALDGSIASRASAAIEAGCDIALYCGGSLGEMIEIATALPQAGPVTCARLDHVLHAIGRGRGSSGDIAELCAKRDHLLMHMGHAGVPNAVHAANGAP